MRSIYGGSNEGTAWIQIKKIITGSRVLCSSTSIRHRGAPGRDRRHDRDRTLSSSECGPHYPKRILYGDGCGGPPLWFPCSRLSLVDPSFEQAEELLLVISCLPLVPLAKLHSPPHRRRRPHNQSQPCRSHSPKTAQSTRWAERSQTTTCNTAAKTPPTSQKLPTLVPHRKVLATTQQTGKTTSAEFQTIALSITISTLLTAIPHKMALSVLSFGTCLAELFSHQYADVFVWIRKFDILTWIRRRPTDFGGLLEES
jgi:hypothetical protein